MNGTSLAQKSVKELTLRGVLLGGIITLVFTAANVYLGLKVGLTFATSIPAAVISMAVLYKFSDHTIQENNIVQTIASAAGTLSAIIFVLPALIMVGYWTGFPYWTTVSVCAVGGILGVMYSIPLRRALVTGSDLKYPEGVAAAEVLKVGDSAGGTQENKLGMKVIIAGGLTSAGYMILTYLKVAAGSIGRAFKIGTSGTLFSAGLSLALIGVGHLVGISVGIAMLVGLSLSYFILVPYYTNGTITAEIGSDAGALLDAVEGVWAGDVRLVGAGAMAIAAVWTLLKILGPIYNGIREASASAKARKAGQTVDITEQDIPIRYVGLIITVCLIPITWLLWDFLQTTVLKDSALLLIIVGLIYIVLIGILVASVCGYMAGLIGASNSPISGVGILVVVVGSVLIKFTFGHTDPKHIAALIGFTLFTASLIFGIATISNDNLQDLKTGQLVGATPWKQQVALVIGVLFGSAIIPPVMELMHQAFGFVGAPGAGPNALAAPQAGLMSLLAKGIFTSELHWSRFGLGVIIGVLIIIVDELLRRTSQSRLSLPPLAVGMGLYLPMFATFTISVGALLGWFYDRWCERTPEDAAKRKRLGVLLSTGLIVGESLIGVIYAGIVAASGQSEPLAIAGDGFATFATILGVVAFAAAIVFLYRFVARTRVSFTGSEDSDNANSGGERHITKGADTV